MRAGERPAREAADTPSGSRPDARYDTALIKDEGERLLSAYLGRPGKVSGSRMVWDCPKCGKPKLSLLRSKGSVGCMNSSCDVETNTDVIGVIASLENLQTRGEDFKKICALSYDLLSIPHPASGDGAGGKAASRNGDDGRLDLQPFQPAPTDVVDAVLLRLLQLCPLEKRDVSFLASRGVAKATARLGRFGSITGRRARHAVGVLDREFSREELRGVPGFRERGEDGGELGFTLWGNFLLIPYFDPGGRVVTLEGRAVGMAPAWAGKYTSLRNGGNHLYVFPAFEVDDLVAICEGPMGAIVAAQEGLAVGAIQGVKRYTQAGTAAGQDAPLPELVRASFGGRTVLYVPDLDVKPDARADVEQHATRACDFLISRQNGRPLIATVPQDATGGEVGGMKDLDAWILSAPEAGLYGVLSRLLSRAHPPEAWPGLPDPGRDPDDGAHRVPNVVPSDAPAAPAPAASSPPASEEREPGRETPEAETVADGTGEPEEAADEEAGAPDAYDRWYALLEGYPGSAELASPPQPYRPHPDEGPAPGGEFVQEAELHWAGLLGLCAAVVFWYYVGASDGWLAGGIGFLPSLPGPLNAALGLPFALLFGAVVGVALLLHVSGRRRAARRHLLGPERK